MFGDETVAAIYASHVLEHVSYHPRVGNASTEKVLQVSSNDGGGSSSSGCSSSSSGCSSSNDDSLLWWLLLWWSSSVMVSRFRLHYPVVDGGGDVVMMTS